MENKDSERKVLISAKVPADLEERIKHIADKETRTLSNTIHILLESHPLLIDAKKEVALAK